MRVRIQNTVSFHSVLTGKWIQSSDENQNRSAARKTEQTQNVSNVIAVHQILNDGVQEEQSRQHVPSRSKLLRVGEKKNNQCKKTKQKFPTVIKSDTNIVAKRITTPTERETIASQVRSNSFSQPAIVWNTTKQT